MRRDPSLFDYLTDIVAFVVAIGALAILTHSLGWWG